MLDELTIGTRVRKNEHSECEIGHALGTAQICMRGQARILRSAAGRPFAPNNHEASDALITEAEAVERHCLILRRLVAFLYENPAFGEALCRAVKDVDDN